MAVDITAYKQIKEELEQAGATLITVSKTKPPEDIEELYDLGQRDFGENYVQELVDKQAGLPGDIRWHFIGHLQSNKVKYIAPFIHLIQGVDSLRLLKEIDKQAVRYDRTIDCLLQVHIASEETKFGFDAAELEEALGDLAAFPHLRIRGLMGMASFTEDPEKVRQEFRGLKALFDKYFLVPEAPRKGDSAAVASHEGDPVAEAPREGGPILSMGMSGDYRMALEEGSTMVRVGSLLFGRRG